MPFTKDFTTSQDYFVRQRRITIGDPEAQPPIEPLLPISNSLFWRLVKKGLIPKPIKLSPRCAVWRISDISAFISGANK